MAALLFGLQLRCSSITRDPQETNPLVRSGGSHEELRSGGPCRGDGGLGGHVVFTRG